MSLKSDRGNIIVALIAVLLLTSAVGFLFFSVSSSDQLQNQRRYLVRTGLNQLLDHSKHILDSPKSFGNTIYGPLNNQVAKLEKCFFDSAYNCPSSGGKLSLYGEDPSTVYFDSTNLSQGFDLNYKLCTGFTDPTNGLCVLRLEMDWKPECPTSGLCSMPPIYLEVRAVVRRDLTNVIDVNTENLKYTKRLR